MLSAPARQICSVISFRLISTIMGLVNKRQLRLLPLFIGTCLLVSLPPLEAQNAASQNVSLLPGTKPADVLPEWKQLVGIYDHRSENNPKQMTIFLEKDQRLFMQPNGFVEQREEIHETDGKVLITAPDGRTYIYDEQHDKNGSVTGFSYLVESFVRVDAGTDPAHFYHITPTKSVEQLRAAALAAKPPVEAGPFPRARPRRACHAGSCDPSRHSLRAIQ